MITAGLLHPLPAPATRLEPATATRRARDDSPYAHNHAGFGARLARAPPPLAADGGLQ
jgi:hypothetical protein